MFPKQAFVTIPQDPDIAQCERRILHNLKGRSAQADFVSNEDGLFWLRTLLQDEIFLFVLNDVWFQRHVKHFKVVSQNSWILITPRNAEVAICVGAVRTRHYVDALDKKKSMKFFGYHAFPSGESLN